MGSLALALLCSFLLAGGGAAAAGRVDVDDMLMMDRFRAWQTRLNRTYATAAERLRRFEVYRANMAIADATNRLGLSYRLGETPFADLTQEEFRARFTTPDLHEHLARARAEARQLITTRAGDVDEDDDGTGELASSVDWRRQGAVTPVKNQFTCGSCWAFCTVASIEGLHKIKTGQLVSLSEQELVDCDDRNDGCDGGVPFLAMAWAAGNGGLTTEADYPYKNKQGKCDRRKAGNHAVKIAGGRWVSPMSEAGLMRAVARQPVAVGMNATLLSLYKGGVYRGPCNSAVDHGVTVVGYGEGAEGKYWIIKNSWGEEWGEKGYLLLPRGAGAGGGMCGVATRAAYPV